MGLCTITSTVRDVPSEVVLDVEDRMKDRCAVNLRNTVTISQDRLGKRGASLSDRRMFQVCAVAVLLGVWLRLSGQL